MGAADRQAQTASADDAQAELLAAAHEALIQFMYQAPIGLLQATADGDITMMNPMSAQLLMPLTADGNLVNLFDTLAPLMPQLRSLVAGQTAQTGSVCQNLRATLARVGDGLPQTLDLSVFKLGADLLMASLNDVSLTVQQEQQRLASRLRDVTRTDSLTSLPNRAVVLERIARALQDSGTGGAPRFALLFINCDRFSRINVTLGQAVGDEMLRLLGGRLASTVRAGDAVAHAGPDLADPPAAPQHMAARLSGDEFVVLLEGALNADDVGKVAQRLLDALCTPYAIGPHQVHASASLGVVLGAQAGAGGDADAVLECAGIAMREAKRVGGARWCLFEPAMKERAARRGSIESDLRHALVAGQLFVVYQPVVGLDEGDERPCQGAEALVRWRHPERGTVPPIEFIEIAEETGLIGALGRFVLDQACRQFMRWQRELGAKAPGWISVNISRAQLGGPDLREHVAQALRASGMAPGQLHLEVTESLAAQGQEVQARLHDLKTLGVGLALDDFGTGYSSLSSLHLLPVDVVKIDRSFVMQAETSPHHRVLIEATVRVARSLGMGTVAEGIETPGQAAILAELQCGKGQGYLFAKPMPAEEMAAWLALRSGVPLSN